MRNRSKYIVPLQVEGKKVCLTIKGGNTGLGFSNLSDNQIEDFVGQLKAYVEVNSLDGINLWDEGAGYDNEGAAPVNGESYAKLIKAIKTAMPDKLLTLVDTRETTEALCDPVAGISVGDYLDYAWSSLNDFLAPYEPDATIRPLASVPENRYATLFVHDSDDMPEESRWDFGVDVPDYILPYLEMTTSRPLSATDVFVYDDVPLRKTSNEGIYQCPAFWMFFHCPPPEDFSSYTEMMAYQNYAWHYNMFKKDW